MNPAHRLVRRVALPLLATLACIASATSASASQCDTATQHLLLSKRPASTLQLAASSSPTDVRYCWRQCSPGSGCEIVCRHLAY